MLEYASEEQDADMENDTDLESMGYGLYLEWGECRDSAEWARRAMASCYVMEEQASRIRSGGLEDILELGADKETVKEVDKQSDISVGKEWDWRNRS